MVKKNLLFLLLIFCISCARNDIEKADYLLEKPNFLYHENCDKIADNLFPQIRLDSITIEGLKSPIKKNELSLDFKKLFNHKILYCLYRDSSDNISDGDQLAYSACGKINMWDGVRSYLVLGTTNGGRLNFFLLNLKKTNLTSIVLVSVGIQDSYIPFSKTYINYNCKSLLLIDRSLMLDGFGFNKLVKQDFWSRMGILKPKERKYFYSSYTIDENGYVKTIPFEKEDFPDYMNY